jgi:hypothetical protein
MIDNDDLAEARDIAPWPEFEREIGSRAETVPHVRRKVWLAAWAAKRDANERAVEMLRSVLRDLGAGPDEIDT